MKGAKEVNEAASTTLLAEQLPCTYAYFEQVASLAVCAVSYVWVIGLKLLQRNLFSFYVSYLPISFSIMYKVSHVAKKKKYIQFL